MKKNYTLSITTLSTSPFEAKSGSLLISLPFLNKIKVGNCQEDPDISILYLSARFVYLAKSTFPNFNVSVVYLFDISE